MVFVNDNWELDTKTGAITANSPFGKKTIAEVFGATDFNTDNEQAMTYARLIQAAPEMYKKLLEVKDFLQHENMQDILSYMSIEELLARID